MKIFKHRNIMGCIFGLMLSLPLLAVLARSAYVIVNKNAYQSYSDSQVRKVELVSNAETYVDSFTYNVKPKFTSHTTSGKQKFSYISIPNLNSNSTQFSVYDNRTGAYLLTFWDDEGNETQRFNWGNPNGGNSFDEFYFTKTSGTGLYGFADVYLIYETTEKLDNVFEYSLDKVIENNNFGNINFLEWFEDMFLSDNQVNNRYVHYFNWYLNYTMFVSCAYILFLCLMWFVNFSRRLLERGMNYDW